MEENLFSLKVILHNIIIQNNVFNENYIKITNPIIVCKFLDFPHLSIEIKNEISQNFLNQPIKKNIGVGKSTIFKYSLESLKELQLKIPLIVLFVDSQETHLIGLAHFDLETVFPSEKENFQRHIFLIFDEIKNVIGQIDISISLVQKPLTFLSKTLENKIKDNMKNAKEEKNEENNQKNKPEFFKSEKYKQNIPGAEKLNYSKINNNTKINNNFTPEKNINYTNNINYEEPEKEISYIGKEDLNKKLETLKKDLKGDLENKKKKNENIIMAQPTLRTIIESNYCPPPMIFENKKIKEKKQKHEKNDKKTITINEQKNQIISNHIPKKSNEIPIVNNNNKQNNEQQLKYFEKIFNLEKSPDKNEDDMQFMFLDGLITDLLMLREIRSGQKLNGSQISYKSKVPAPLIVKDSPISKKSAPTKTAKENNDYPEEYPDDFEASSVASLQRTSLIKSARNKPNPSPFKKTTFSNYPIRKDNKKENDDDYPDDFEASSVASLQRNPNIKSPSRNILIKSNYSPNRSVEMRNIPKDKDYLEHSNSNSQSHSNSKMIECCFCKEMVEASKVSEHIKNCKNKKVKTTPKNIMQNSLNESPSIISIEEEDEIKNRSSILFKKSLNINNNFSNIFSKDSRRNTNEEINEDLELSEEDDY